MTRQLIGHFNFRQVHVIFNPLFPLLTCWCKQRMCIYEPSHNQTLPNGKQVKVQFLKPQSGRNNF